jgi:hypothetical protein
MDATTPSRGDDQTTPAEPQDSQPHAKPPQPPNSGGSSAVDAAAAPERTSSPTGAPVTSSPSDGIPPARDDGPEDPTAPDTAVEARLTSEPAGSRPDEPVRPTGHPADAQAAAPHTADHPAEETAPAQPAEPSVVHEQPHQAAPAAQAGQTHQPVPAPQAPQPVPPAAPGQEVVYVAAPAPPKKKGNRGIGVLLAALSTLLFLAVYVGVVVLINSIQGRGTGVEFLGRLEFYIPALLFAIGFVLLAAIVNRAGWWSFVLGSFFVGAFVYLGTVGVLLLSQASSLTPDAAVLAFRSLLISPIVVAAGLVAREVALWVGAAISARGRRVKARNAEARARFDREQAEHRAEIERAGAAVRPV